jgi:hypothetical protein
MTRTSFHGGWYVGFIVRVVLCSVRACESFDDDVNVDGWEMGVLSIAAIIREVSLSAEAGWTGSVSSLRPGICRRTPCSNHLPRVAGARGSNGPLLRKKRLWKLLEIPVLIVDFYGQAYPCTTSRQLRREESQKKVRTDLFSSSLRPSSGHEAKISRVRFALLRKRGSRGGRAAAAVVMLRARS